MFSLIKAKIKENREEKTRVNDVKYDILVGRPKLNSFVKLWFITVKNFKLLIRSKFSALIFLLGPLLLIALVCLAFNTSSLYDLNVAVYSDSYSELSEQIIGTLQDQQYNVLKLDSAEECIDAVKFSDFQLCAIFPADMSISNDATNNVITLYVDNSRINIANLISSQMNAKVESESAELSTTLVSQLINVINVVNTEATSSKSLTSTALSKTTDINTQASNVDNNLNELSFTYTAVAWGTIEDEIENLNCSGKNDLEDLIEESKTNYNIMVSIITSASSTIGDVGTTIDSLQSNIGTVKTNLQSIDSSLNTISNNVATLQVTDVGSIVNPITTKIEPISSSNNYLAYLLPTLLVMVIMFVALLMSSSTVLTEKMANAHFRNNITPTKESAFIMGNFISNLLIITFQIIILLSVIYYFLKDQLSWQTLGFMGLVLFMLTILFIGLGMIIGYIFNTKQTVTLAALSTGLILLFFSNTLLPLETLSSSVRKFIMYNPFVMGEGLLKKFMLFNVSINEVGMFFYILIGISIGLFLLTILVSSIFNKLTKL